MSSFDDISEMFRSEFDKLTHLLNSTNIDSNLSPTEIVEIYYQIMNMSSMNVMLKQQLNSDDQKSLLDEIIETEKLISEKFNHTIHPQILEKLTQSIQDITTNLQSSSSGQKSKEEIENEAKQYDELRQKMSTKEFVEQYGKGLSND
jgi:hypothetical protein